MSAKCGSSHISRTTKKTVTSAAAWSSSHLPCSMITVEKWVRSEPSDPNWARTPRIGFGKPCSIHAGSGGKPKHHEATTDYLRQVLSFGLLKRIFPGVRQRAASSNMAPPTIQVTNQVIQEMIGWYEALRGLPSTEKTSL